MKISLVDYGVGNIFSVGQALKFLNRDFTLDVDGSSISNSDLVIVPGVASYGIGMENLENRGQAQELRSFHRAGKPLIGLCLGAQMFLDSSTESLETIGLGFSQGTVSKLDDTLCRVPQQGWSKIDTGESATFADFNQEYFYFSHSYKMQLIGDLSSIAYSSHNQEKVTAFFVDKNVLGVQFHPERSGTFGLSFLEKAIAHANIWA